MFQGEFTAFLMSTRESFSGSPVTVAMSVDDDVVIHRDAAVSKQRTKKSQSHGNGSSHKSHNHHQKQHSSQQQHYQLKTKKQQQLKSPTSSPITTTRRRKIVVAPAAPEPLSLPNKSWLEAQREWLSNAFGTGSTTTSKVDHHRHHHHHVNVTKANDQWQKQQDIKQSSSSSSSNCSSRRVSFALTEDSTLPSSSSSSSRSLSSIEDDDENEEEERNTKTTTTTTATTTRTDKTEAVVSTEQKNDAKTCHPTLSITSTSSNDDVDVSIDTTHSSFFVGLKGFHQYTLAQSFWHQHKLLEAMECYMKALKQQTRISHTVEEEDGQSSETAWSSSQGEMNIKELLFQVMIRKEMAQLLLQIVVTGSHSSSSLKTPAQWRRVRQLAKEHVPLPSSLSSTIIPIDQVSLENNDLCFHAILELQTCETLFDQAAAATSNQAQIQWQLIEITYLKYQFFVFQQQQQQHALSCLLKCQALLHEYRNSYRNNKLHQQLIWMYKECGNVYYQQGDYSSAVQHYTMAHQLGLNKAMNSTETSPATAASSTMMAPYSCAKYLKRRISLNTPFCKNTMYAHVNQMYWTDDQVV